MHAAPALLELLPPSALAALLSCSKQIRAQLQQAVSTIHLDHEAQIVEVDSRDWPRLSLIHLRILDWKPILQYLCTDKPDIVAELELSTYTTEPRHLLFLLSQQQHNPISPCQHPALLHLQQPQYAICVLILKHSMLDTDSLAQLTKPDWPSLTHLDVSGNRLDVSAIACLSKGNWPDLQHLDVRHCGLNTECMAQLVQGDWPELDHLKLSANPCLDAASMALLSTANWEDVSDVEVACMPFDVTSFTLLLQLWTRLLSLELSWTGCGTAAMQQLSVSQLDLCWLHLSGNELGAHAMESLVGASLPSLRGLFLDENNLDAAAAEQLCRGNWPRLALFDLSDNSLDNAAMRHLSQGIWPSLKELKVSVNSFNEIGLFDLARGQWPELERLELHAHLVVLAATWAALALDLAHWSSVADQLHARDCCSIPRSSGHALLPDHPRMWPHLDHVLFYRKVTTRCADGTRVMPSHSEWVASHAS